MLRTGKEHLESLRDGRVVYVGGERIDDVTRHPYFREAAKTVAGLYDLKTGNELPHPPWPKSVFEAQPAVP